ncbi:MAG: HNH endonuclease signature motif containing protein [Candidatus Paceibacterota bacterium]|jgi:hypothetical protein
MNIPLGRKGYFSEIDDADLILVQSVNWQVLHSGNTSYASGITKIGDIKKPVLMHRLIMGCPFGTVVDHINGNGLDNRRENLRIVTHKENSQNLHFEGSCKKVRRSKSVSLTSDRIDILDSWRHEGESHTDSIWRMDRRLKKHNEKLEVKE